MPRMVCTSFLSKGSSILARKRRMATSTTLVSESKFMSHTWEAIMARESTSPWRRANSHSKANSLAVNSMRWPARVTLRLKTSISRSASTSVSAWRVFPRRMMVVMRATSSEKSKGLTR